MDLPYEYTYVEYSKRKKIMNLISTEYNLYVNVD